MRGMRIRRPSASAVAGDIIESMGASPVGRPANDIYTSLQRGVVDGLSFPWEAMETFEINELTKYHTNMPYLPKTSWPLEKLIHPSQNQEFNLLA